MNRYLRLVTFIGPRLWYDPVPISAPKALGHAINAWANRNRLIILTDVFDIQLVPVSDVAQFSGAWRRPRVPAVVSTGTNA